MKLTIFLLFIALVQASAKGYSQKVNLDATGVPLEKVMSTIQRQTGYTFLFADPALKKIAVTVQVKEVSVEEALKACFSKLPVTYKIVAKNILLKKAPFVKWHARHEAVSPATFFTPPPRIETIHGRVTDTAGVPLAGVSVVVKGTKIGTTTGDDGYFTFDNIALNLENVDPEEAILVISHVGYKTTEIKLNGRTNIVVALKIAVNELEEIAVTVNNGYQTISKERATGAFDVIRPEQLDKPSTNIASRLVGAVAGVQATLDVDGNPTFQIRGQTSLYANSQPLVVVDGFATQGDFNSVNPNDVESVTILKDAAAASIWGARSANGVIVITTKKAKKGTPLRVEFNVFTRVGNKFDLDYANPLASSSETIDYEKLLFSKNG